MRNTSETDYDVRKQRVVINGTWKIFGLDRRYKWCPAGIGPRTNSLPYVH